MNRVVVIGAGIGGLSSAVTLARAGYDVHVVEAHIYPGGCAGTFFHQGYRFDAGATLAGGFYPGGPMDLLAQTARITDWPGKSAEAVMMVHLPDGFKVTRWGDDRRFTEHREAFGGQSERFFSWQESTADALWDLALRKPAWPPQTADQFIHLFQDAIGWLGDDYFHRLSPSLLADAVRPVNYHLTGLSDRLRNFVDAQLLISAQTTSAHANALYGASALDLPRRGVLHLEGGIGTIAETIVNAIRNFGGKVSFRKEVTRIIVEKNRPVGVELKHGETILADIVIANLPPWNIAHLLKDHLPRQLHRLSGRPSDGWGAFMLYLGVGQDLIPPDFPLHHQVINHGELGEGNSIFLSINPEWDRTRAPVGQRVLTISTHTAYQPWWNLFARDRKAYDRLKQSYTDRMLFAAERALPGIRAAIDFMLPGTPLSFERFTRRTFGWVGGFPQVSLFKSWGPRLAPGIWMVGDSIFPGQSIAAVALGGMRVASDIQSSMTKSSTRKKEMFQPIMQGGRVSPG